MALERDIDVAEYILGTLSPEEREQLAQALESDPGLRETADQWAAWLADMEGLTEEVTPSPAVWLAIEAALNREADIRPARRPAPSVWHSLRFWRGLAIATTAAAVLVVAIGLWLFGPFNDKPALVAVLNSQAGEPALIVSANARGDRIEARPVAPIATDSRVLELWMIAPGRPVPVSVGLLDNKAPVSLRMPESLRSVPPEKLVLAVSLEPPGGSPADGPTGPVLYQGRVLRLTP